MLTTLMIKPEQLLVRMRYVVMVTSRMELKSVMMVAPTAMLMAMLVVQAVLTRLVVMACMTPVSARRVTVVA